MTEWEFIEHFPGYEKSGDKINIFCPICDRERKHRHGEIKKSVDKSGKALWMIFCHKSGCDWKDMISAAGLEPKDIYMNDETPAKSKTAVSRREHIYPSESSAPIGKKVIEKYSDGSKSCQWYRPLSGRWEHGLNGQKMPLYHLDKLLKSKDPIVYIVEGEKDVETLESWGLVATSCPNGAPSWRDSDAVFFKGKYVVVISDNDDPGKIMGEKTADSVRPYADGVTVVATSLIWTEAPEHADISDVAAKFGNEKALSMLNDAQSKVDEWLGSDCKMRKAKAASQFGEDNTKFLWYPYLPIGDYSVMMADGGTGKTILCCGISAAVSAGKNLPGETFGREKENVLIISAEDRGEMLKKRLSASGADLDRVYILDCMDSEGMDFSDGYSEFMNTVQSYHPSLVIIDPWHAFLGGDVDINRVNAIRPVFQKLANMAKKCECAMILVSHVNKRSQGENANNAATGSTDFVNAARSAVRVIFDETDEDSRIMVHTKTNYAAYGQSVKYKIDDGGVVWDGFSDITRSTLEEAARKRSTPFEVRQENENRSGVNSALVEAIKSAANPFVATTFSYEEFKEKNGELIFGGSQPKRALDSIKDGLLDDGYAVRTGIHVKRNGKPVNGFTIQLLSQNEAKQVDLLS